MVSLWGDKADLPKIGYDVLAWIFLQRSRIHEMWYLCAFSGRAAMTPNAWSLSSGLRTPETKGILCRVVAHSSLADFELGATQ